MTRIGWLLTAVLCVLLAVGWYFLVYSPTSDEIADVRAQTEDVETQVALTLERAEALREIRQGAPEAEAALAAGQQLVPDDAAIPSLFRQLQLAADDAGVQLTSIAPSEPTVEEIGTGEAEVAVIDVSMSVNGSYFQLVDLARRLEDPLLTPRALKWTAASITPAEYPELLGTFSAHIYARGTTELPVLETEEEEADADEGDEAEEDGDPTADVNDEEDLEVDE